MNIGSAAKSGLALTLAGGIVCAASSPLNAGDDDVLSTGIIGATTLGILAGSTFAADRPRPRRRPYPIMHRPLRRNSAHMGSAAGMRRVRFGMATGSLVGRVRVCD